MNKYDLFLINIVVSFIFFTACSVSIAQTCSVDEISTLFVAKSEECATLPEPSGYNFPTPNYVSISSSRINHLPGTFVWSFRSDSVSGTWQSLSSNWEYYDDVIGNLYPLISDTGQYRVIFIDSAGCSDTAYAFLSLNIPTQLSVIIDSVSCDGLHYRIYDASNPSGIGNYYSVPAVGVIGGPGCILPGQYFSFEYSTPCGMGYFTESYCNNDFNDLLSFAGSSDTICQGESSNLYVIRSYAGMMVPGTWTLQWFRNGIPIPGATLSEYDVMKSGTYVCTAINELGCAKSTDPVHITVVPGPLSTISQAGAQAVCGAAATVLTASSSTAISYDWYRNSQVVVQSANSVNVILPGRYKVLATSANGCTRFSPSFSVFSYNVKAVAQGGTSICAGDSILLSAQVTGVPSSYQWLRNNLPVSGAEFSTFYAKQKGRYKVVSISTDGCIDTSNSINVTINCRGLEWESTSQVSFYPNPAQDLVELRYEGDQPERIELYNMLGEKVYDSPWRSSITVSGLAAGLYLVRISGAGETEMLRMEVVR